VPTPRVTTSRMYASPGVRPDRVLDRLGHLVAADRDFEAD